MARPSRSRRAARPAAIADDTLRRLIFRTFGHQRFTQDSPILPDVWLAYARAERAEALDLILTPRAGHSAGIVALALEQALDRHHQAETGVERRRRRAAMRLAYSRSSVVVRLTFDELICVAVPMTSWWRGLPSDLAGFAPIREWLGRPDGTSLKRLLSTTKSWEYLRFVVLAGFVAILRTDPDPEALARELQADANGIDGIRPILRGFLDLTRTIEPAPAGGEPGEIWNVSLNRTTATALFESRAAVKGDAAQNVFQIRSQGLAWAVVDCGIDAAHPAFLDRARFPLPAGGQDIPVEQSRIVATYDFTFLRDLLSRQAASVTTAAGRRIRLGKAEREALRDLNRRVGLGREVDWDLILPIITVPHRAGDYRKPAHEHGTHVAGILAGNWPAAENDEALDLIGLCPDLRLYDFRVFDQDGNGDEFTIMAALQVVAHLNRNRDNPVIHGVNLSLSLKHEVISYACGRTPICEECSRLVGDGVVVVAAAGNQGFEDSLAAGGPFGAYRGISITDPGNADAVITVGSTHRSHPHSYGVSYFSSRGPTGDGRRKPDLVAPGEKVTAPIPNRGAKRMDGTSMAAPHVSGAAALLMARHRELVGHPERIKEVLCRSATDLGREANFQGAGMLDILRALQSV